LSTIASSMVASTDLFLFIGLWLPGPRKDYLMQYVGDCNK